MSVPDAAVQSQHALLFARLELEAAGASLRPVEPFIPADALGAVEGYGFERSDPDVSYAFYLYESHATLDPAFDRWVMQEEANQYLPAGARLVSGASSSILMLAYYYADGSHGDPDDALDALYDVLSRVAGEE